VTPSLSSGRCVNPVRRQRSDQCSVDSSGQEAKMLHDASWDAPGWSRTRCWPLLNASGGQVIGSTANPNRLGEGCSLSAV